MAKKRTTKKQSVKITPKIPQQKYVVPIETLGKGDFFIYDGNLYQMYDKDPCATCISDAKDRGFADGTMVRPVDVKIQWTYRK